MTLAQAIHEADAEGKSSVERPYIGGVSVDVVQFRHEDGRVVIDIVFSTAHGQPLKLSRRRLCLFDLDHPGWVPSDIVWG